MNKLVFSLSLLLTIGISNLLAQCTPDALALLPVSPLTDTTVVNQPYSQTITISVPADTAITVLGQSFTVSIIKMTVMPSPPAPFSTACDITSCTWNGGQKGCIQVTGTPTVVGTASIPMSINITFINPLTQQPTTQALPSPAPFNIEVIAGSNAIEEVLDVNAFRFAPCSPSPADANTTLSFSTPIANDMTLEMYDLSGASIKTASIRANAGINKYDLNVAGIASGMYILSLNNGTRTLTQRLIVK